MKCTECNREVLPVVSVDIDGTLGNFHGHFWDFLRGYLGIEVPDPTLAYTGYESFHLWAQRNYGIEYKTWQDIKLAYRQGGMKRTMPIYPQARWMCDKIRNFPAELWLTTTRPYLRLDNIDPDTRFWLSHHGIQYDGLVYGENKYEHLHRCVGAGRVVAVLDDLIEECNNAALWFGDDVVINARNNFNIGARKPYPYLSLHDAGAVILNRLREWKRDNASENC